MEPDTTFVVSPKSRALFRTRNIDPEELQWAGNKHWDHTIEVSPHHFLWGGADRAPGSTITIEVGDMEPLAAE